MFRNDISTYLSKAPFVPVIMITDLSSAVPLAKALAAGGVKVIEIALRTPEALEAISLISKECPDLTVGAATVMSTTEMKDAIDAGAHFCASPMFDLDLLKYAKKNNYSYLPCVSDLAQINTAAKEGFHTLKLFPMDSMGDGEDGEKFLRGNKGMISKLNVKFCTSCLETKPSDIEKYLNHPSVISVASGWSTPAELVAAKDWQAIAAKTKQDMQRAEKAMKLESKMQSSVPIYKPTLPININPLPLKSFSINPFLRSKKFSYQGSSKMGMLFFGIGLGIASTISYYKNTAVSKDNTPKLSK